MSDDNEIHNEMMSDNKETLPVLSTDPDERMWAMFCHLGTLVTWFPSANIIVPLVIWLAKKEKYPLVNDQGKEALNFQITILIGYAICIPFFFVLIGIPAFIALGIYHVVFSIIAAIKSNEGRAYRYPYTFRLID
jgi:uncharacterized Tic20 family protein